MQGARDAGEALADVGGERWVEISGAGIENGGRAGHDLRRIG